LRPITEETEIPSAILQTDIPELSSLEYALNDTSIHHYRSERVCTWEKSQRLRRPDEASIMAFSAMDQELI
jgi:hypothetical protein